MSKKKQLKKLSLKTVTLSNLSKEEASAVYGGMQTQEGVPACYTNPQNTVCGPTNAVPCPSEPPTCEENSQPHQHTCDDTCESCQDCPTDYTYTTPEGSSCEYICCN